MLNYSVAELRIISFSVHFIQEAIHCSASNETGLLIFCNGIAHVFRIIVIILVCEVDINDIHSQKDADNYPTILLYPMY